ncbi:transposase from transposon Tn916 [mine drainage metagenome]|uniref:Transposase from transposon Tn916 n=1 Tax=mine drainage metagenome TaxID=410659 RepID=A0A1J5RFI0_9ZZZZ
MSSQRAYCDSRGEVVGVEAYVNIPNPSGGSYLKRKKVFRFDAYGGKRAARGAASEWEAEQRRLLRTGEYIDPTVQRVTLAQYWAQNCDVILDGLRPNVRRNYVTSMRVVIGPVLGHVTLADLKPSHLDALKREMRSRGMAPSTCNGVINALSRILAYGVRDRRIPRNFCRDDGVRLRVPKPMAGDRTTLTPTQVEDLAAAIDAVRLGYGNPVRVAFYTGVRAEELWALQAGDVDLDARRITVRRAWTGTDENGRVMGLPKSGSGRLVPILTPVRDLLARLVEGLDPEEWLFVGERGNALWHGNYRQRITWTKVVADQGFPGLRFHELRHSCASWLAESGVPLTAVQAILGHSDARVTQLYIHTPDRLLDEAIRATEGTNERKAS